MSSYFKYLPQTEYYYGDENLPVAANNLTAYVDIIDQIKKNIEYYSIYYIQEDDRPDILSHKLYDTTDYHWTFFFLNDNLKSGGWPIQTERLNTHIRNKYNRVVITTEQDIIKDYTAGTKVIGSYSNLIGTVVDRRLEYGQIILETELDSNNQHKMFSVNPQTGLLEILKKVVDDSVAIIPQIETYTQTEQYNSIRRYVDPSDGDEVFPDISNLRFDASSVSTMLPVTQLEHYLNENTKLREISVIKKDVITQVVNEFKRLMK